MLLRKFILCTIVSALVWLPVWAQENAPANSPGAKHDLRDGTHDFDFDFGTWKTYSSRLLHPLTGSTTWAEMDGITVVKKVWDGRANLAEFKADGPAGPIELLSLRYYNPTARQWSLAFATPNVGKLSIPCIGEFRNGRGDFYDQEEFNGKQILVRFSIWKITEYTAQSEQAFSADGGRTWEVNWVNKYTRKNDQTEIDWTDQNTSQPSPGAHDFDFNLGTWHTHIRRNLDPFANNTTSIELNGTVTVRKVWGGRAQLEEIEADGPKRHWEALTLFLYNPSSHQWSQTFINSRLGVITSAMTGALKDGNVELLQQDTFNDRSILVRATWSDIAPNSHSYTESFSDDGGKSWKTSFIAHLTRLKE